MKKLVPALIVAVIVLAFAGALFVRFLMHGDSFAPGETAVMFPPAADDHPQVMWSVASSRDEDAKGYAYSLATKKTVGPIEGFEGPGVARFNQSTGLCEKNDQDSIFKIECNFNSVVDVLVLTVYGMMDEEKWMHAYTIDLKDLGVFSSLEDGYLTPVAVADDKSAIYLGRRVETESYVAGLWRLDIPSGVITEITDVRKHNLYQYEINTRQKTLVGVTFVPPENLGADPTGPSSAYLVDLDTNKSRLLAGAAVASTKSVVENPMVSEDGMEYAVHLYGSPLSTVTSIKGPSVATVNGVVKDWFGDTMVVDRDGNLFLYDLATKIETQLTHETDATVEYLGVIK